MAKKQKKGKPAVPRIKDFLDMIAPAAAKFNTDSYILGSSYRCTPALRSYPTTTEELALLCHLGKKAAWPFTSTSARPPPEKKTPLSTTPKTKTAWVGETPTICAGASTPRPISRTWNPSFQFERVLPASSVANLFPFNYSGKNDPNGFYVGRDRYGSNIILDLDRRAEDKTNANVLILGNSGQGKSFLLKNFFRSYKDFTDRHIDTIELIAHPQNGVCLFKCGNERYLLEIHAPDHIRALFGEAGGR